MSAWIFFFKQKTAYEMRISDWSSDVCSSDLLQQQRIGAGEFERLAVDVGQRPLVEDHIAERIDQPPAHPGPRRDRVEDEGFARLGGKAIGGRRVGRSQIGRNQRAERSEEHTSELQSLMRISSAVFCLQ